MKGIEWKVIMAIILLFVILALITSIFILPIISTGETIEPTRNFWWYCNFWRVNAYRGTVVTIDGEEVNMNPLCTRQLGILCFNEGGCMPDNPNDPLWEKCRDVCKFKEPEG